MTGPSDAVSTPAAGASGNPGSGTRDALAVGADRAGAFSVALATLGIHCTVEARGSLAVVAIVADDRRALVVSLADHGLRAAVVSAAHDLGFTNVALELRGEDG